MGSWTPRCDEFAGKIGKFSSVPLLESLQHWNEINKNYLVVHPTNRKWVITPLINGISRVNPLITGVVTHLLSGMNHQVFVVFQTDKTGMIG